MLKQFILLGLLIGIVARIDAAPSRIRLIWRGDTATTATIGWDAGASSNNSDIVYFDTVDHGIDISKYRFKQKAQTHHLYKGMNNAFSRLTGLRPSTQYFIVIAGARGHSPRYWFKTSHNDSKTPMTIIAGGDSRNNRTPRRNGNLIVRQLRPDAVIFAGDMTGSGTNSQWKRWFNDWQLTIAKDGQLFPIITARGNHESRNTDLEYLFDTTPGVYYSTQLGGDLVNVFALNTESSISGNQTNWLNKELQKSDRFKHRMAFYHKPMRPHTRGKSEGSRQYKHWAPLFYQHQVRLVMESDAHTVKTTYPVRPSYDSGHDEGFIRDDKKGMVFVGEGCWGAPLRSNNDDKKWTRASGKFNQVKWIHVFEDRIEVRTVKTHNAESVGSVDKDDRFKAPNKLTLWRPQSGAVVTIGTPKPEMKIKIKTDSGLAHFKELVPVSIKVEVENPPSENSDVVLFVDGVEYARTATQPYRFTFDPKDFGLYELKVKMHEKASRVLKLSFGHLPQRSLATIKDGIDDVEFRRSGRLYTNSSDLEIVSDGDSSGRNQIIGVRFRGLSIPKNAQIINAEIVFTAKGSSSGIGQTVIEGLTVADNKIFNSGKSLKERNSYDETISWTMSSWKKGGVYSTPGLKPLVQAMVEDKLYKNNSALAFRIKGAGTRRAYSYEGSPAHAPKIIVDYLAPEEIIDEPNPIGREPAEDDAPLSQMVLARIQSSDDDAEMSKRGNMYFSSSDLELVDDKGGNGRDQKVGLVFRNLEIPQGAHIEQAYIQFTAKGDSDGEAMLDIHYGGFRDLRSRRRFLDDITLSAAVAVWQPGPWRSNGAGKAQRTSDLSALVTEAIGQETWPSHKTLSFVIIGKGLRRAYSFNGDAKKAPRLIIKFSH